MDCIEMYCVWVNLKNVGPLFVQIIFTVSVYTCIKMSFTVHSWKIILSCNVAMILQMKDSWSANLTFRTHN